jgi:hypothetical protein
MILGDGDLKHRGKTEIKVLTLPDRLNIILHTRCSMLCETRSLSTGTRGLRGLRQLFDRLVQFHRSLPHPLQAVAFYLRPSCCGHPRDPIIVPLGGLVRP